MNILNLATFIQNENSFFSLCCSLEYFIADTLNITYYQANILTLHLIQPLIILMTIILMAWSIYQNKKELILSKTENIWYNISYIISVIPPILLYLFFIIYPLFQDWNKLGYNMVQELYKLGPSYEINNYVTYIFFPVLWIILNCIVFLINKYKKTNNKTTYWINIIIYLYLMYNASELFTTACLLS